MERRRRRRGGSFGLFNYGSRMLTGGAGDDTARCGGYACCRSPLG